MVANREASPRFASSPPRRTAALASLTLVMACSAGEGADPVPSFGGPPGLTGTGGSGAQQPVGAAGTNPGVNTGGAAGQNTGSSGGNGQQSGLAGGSPVGTAQGGSSSSPAGLSGAGGQPVDPVANPAGAGGQPQQPPGDVTSSGDCPDLFLCDGFEGAAVGSSPAPSLWSLVVGNYDYNSTQSPNVLVSSANARSGTQSVRVESQGAINGIIATIPEDRFFLRVWLQVDAAPRGPALIGIGTDHNSETRLRIFNDSRAIINTFGPGDAVHPGEASTPTCPDCVSLPTNEWFCAEFFIDNAAQNATLWIDGEEAASIQSGEGGWPQQPGAPKVRIGCMSIEGGQTGVWIDDVAAGPERIGCD